MLNAETLLAFIVTAFIMVVIPGPNVLFIIGRSISLGRIGGFLSILGTAVGSLLLVVGVAVGVGTVIAQSVVLFTIVKVLGAGYLIFLGIQAIRHRGHAADAMAEGTARTAHRKQLVQGFLVGITNPKSIAFFVAILPQFIDLQAGSVPVQLLILGVIVVTVGVICDAAWVIASSAARTWFARSPRRLSAMGATGGALMIGLGAFLLVWSEKPAAT